MAILQKKNINKHLISVIENIIVLLVTNCIYMCIFYKETTLSLYVYRYNYAAFIGGIIRLIFTHTTLLHTAASRTPCRKG